MSEQYKQVFSCIDSAEPTVGLFARIMQRIEEQKKIKIFRAKMIASFCALIVSTISFFPVFETTKNVVVESGFSSYLSLLLTDTKMIITYWENFGSALIESLPALQIAFLLLIIFVVLDSLKIALNNLSKILASKKFNHI
jgi:hypothetical protein